MDRLDSFLRNFPEFPNAFLVGGAGDFLVIELTDQVLKRLSVNTRKICSEEVTHLICYCDAAAKTESRTSAATLSFSDEDSSRYFFCLLDKKDYSNMEPDLISDGLCLQVWN